MDEAMKRLESSAEGIGADEAEARLKSQGPNSLEAGEGINPWKLLWRQINSPLIYLMMVATLVSLFGHHTVDAAVIAGVIILNTILGFIQEWRAEGALEALRSMAAPHAQVVRDGEPVQVDASNVVPGDILLLETGQRVAADARVIQSDDLHVDESSLTGESEPIAKLPGEIKEGASLGDRTNMVWMSTGITGGHGRAVVVETGMQTQIGKIAGGVRSTKREVTPLQEKMQHLGMVLGGGGLALAVLIFFLGLIRGHEVMEMLMFAVATAVAAIPEGLPAVITVTLALGVRRMAQHNAIIRRLPAVETLGSTTVICTDKTGTITRNQMTVRGLWADETPYGVSGEGYSPEGEVQNAEGEKIAEITPALERLLTLGALCNNARVVEKDGEWKVEGNPSEGALLVAAAKAGLAVDAMRENANRIDEIPFSSKQKYMATLHAGESANVAWVKGAPDRILNYCSHTWQNGERVEMSEALREEIAEAIENFSARALRVLAGAYREFPTNKPHVEPDEATSGLTFVGLWAMFDPPRSQSAEAVKAAKAAGIRPILITGDYATTAQAIAEQVGVSEGGRALGADEIENMEPDELADAAMESGVFARVSPQHKLTIMQALKGKGHVVAMTGDGVNDAPALKGADIGVAMGQGGTEVAKEAADMVLTDDNFATIVKAIEEGRVIYSNLRRVVYFLLSTNLGEILTLAGALMLGLDLPLTAVMILWVNLITDGTCTVPMGVEPLHADVLKQPPRDPKENIMNKAMYLRMSLLTPIMAFGTLLMFWIFSQSDVPAQVAKAQTVAFTTLVAFQWFQALNARSEHQSVLKIGFFSNRWLIVGIAIAIVLQIFAVQTPLGHRLFRTEYLSLGEWLWILLVSSSIFIVEEARKFIVNLQR